MPAPFLFMKPGYLNFLFAIIALSIFSLLDVTAPYAYLGILFMLLFPFADSEWLKPDLSLRQISVSFCLVFILILILLLINPHEWQLIISSLLLAALPEEWFFRSYILMRLNQFLQSSWQANTLTSILFSLFHISTQGWFGLSVIIPSLIFGWVYLKTNNILLVIGIHTVSNIIFIIYLKEMFVLD